MTLAELYSQIHARSGILARRLELDGQQGTNVASREADEGVLLIFARQGAAIIARRTRRMEAQATINLVDGTAAYDLGTAVGTPRRMHLVDADGALSELAHVEGDSIWPATHRDTVSGTKGTPTCFGIYAGMLYVWPIPDAAYTGYLYYESSSAIGEEDALTTSETPAGDLLAFLPAEMERPLSDYVLSEWYREIGQHGEAALLMRRFEEDLKRFSSNPHAPKVYHRSYKPYG